jgi:hypothetical protein
MAWMDSHGIVAPAGWKKKSTLQEHAISNWILIDAHAKHEKEKKDLEKQKKKKKKKRSDARKKGTPKSPPKGKGK